MSTASTSTQAEHQQVLQVGILVSTLGIVMCLIGLYPGITGVEPKSGIGILQIFIILVGLSLIILGGFIFVRVVFFAAEEGTLVQRIAVRLSLTGLLFSVATGLSDILGYGSNPPEGADSSPILGWFQSGGIVLGFIIASLGVVIYVMSRSEEEAVTDTGLDGLQIRPITPDDAGKFLNLCQGLDDETQFMLLEPGERQLNSAEQRAMIETILATDGHTILVADYADQLIGYIHAEGGGYERNIHSATLVIGVRQDYVGRGIGTRLILAIEEWARANNIHRLELSVMRHNKAAIGLYQKMGFLVEGTRTDALKVGGAYVDEYYMARILNR